MARNHQFIKLLYARIDRWGKRNQREKVYDTEGISPALSTEPDKNAHIIVQEEHEKKTKSSKV